MLKGIIDWNKERNIPQELNLTAEMGYLLEEMTELARANAPEEQADAFCDMIVFCAGAIWKLGYDPDKCLAEVLKEINDRKGSWDDTVGKWMKVPQETQYKADFSLCILEDLND